MQITQLRSIHDPYSGTNYQHFPIRIRRKTYTSEILRVMAQAVLLLVLQQHLVFHQLCLHLGFLCRATPFVGSHQIRKSHLLVSVGISLQNALNHRVIGTSTLGPWSIH